MLGDTNIIFTDGLEGGDFDDWSYYNTVCGSLTVATGDAAIIGDYGFTAQIVNGNQNVRYVYDNSPEAETHYRARFYVDPNSIVMGDGEQFTIFADNNEKFWVDLKYDSTAVSYYLIAGTEDDNSTATTTSEYAITDDWFAVEIEWRAASGAGMNDGFLELWIGGNLMQTLSGIDNDTITINGVKLGAVGYLDTNTSGTIYFDQFTSTRGEGEIGLASPEDAMLYDHGTSAASSLKILVPLSAKYVYDGDGNMVMSIINGVITYYPGRHYQKEVNGETVTMKKYYAAAGMTVAVRTIQGTTDTLNWLLSDHLGSTSVTANADGTLLAKVKYTAFGEVRESTEDTPTDYLYTGQLSQMSEIGLYFYVARFYDPQLAHFISADTLIPNAGSAISYDRYDYVSYNPIILVDPSGHLESCGLSNPSCYSYWNFEGKTPQNIIDGMMNGTDPNAFENITELTKGGEKTKELYERMASDTSSEWYKLLGDDADGFTVTDFFTVMMYFEIIGDQYAGAEDFEKFMSDAVAGNLSLKCKSSSTGGYCGGMSENAIFNYLSSRESVRNRYNITIDGPIYGDYHLAQNIVLSGYTSITPQGSLADWGNYSVFKTWLNTDKSDEFSSAPICSNFNNCILFESRAGGDQRTSPNTFFIFTGPQITYWTNP